MSQQHRYSERFKGQMVRRMMGPGGISAYALAKEVGLPQPTLSRWAREAGNVIAVKGDKTETRAARRPEDWTPQEKLAAVLEAATVAESDLGLWLRRKGLKEEHLRQWRTMLGERAAAVFSPTPARLAAATTKRIKDLERDLLRKDKALAETAALLVLQGKMQALWAEEDDATRQTSGEPFSRPLKKQNRRGHE